MKEIHIIATGDALTVNGCAWRAAPPLADFCEAIGADPKNLVDGGNIIIQGKPASRFAYFDDLGIGIIESIPGGRVMRISLNMETPSRKRKPPRSDYRSYGAASERRSTAIFQGRLDINGKQLRSPVKATQFPLKGDIPFVHRIAIVSHMSAGYSLELGFISRVSFDLKE